MATAYIDMTFMLPFYMVALPIVTVLYEAGIIDTVALTWAVDPHVYERLFQRIVYESVWVTAPYVQIPYLLGGLVWGYFSRIIGQFFVTPDYDYGYYYYYDTSDYDYIWHTNYDYLEDWHES